MSGEEKDKYEKFRKENERENGIENGKIKWKLNEIRDDLLDEIDELRDEFDDEVEDLIDKSFEMKEELQEELIELEEERESLLDEIGEMRGELRDLGDGAREKIYDKKENLKRLREKIRKQEAKFQEKVAKKLEKAERKAVKRINISVDEEMSDEWKDWAEGLGASVSELVRKSMKFVKNNIGDIAKLEQWGRKMEKMGDKIERAVEKSGIEDLGRQIEEQFGDVKSKPKVKIAIATEADKERIKKRVRGLVKLHNAIPIEKLANTINKSTEFAENIIYELVDEGIGGSIEGNEFKFTNDQEEVITKLLDILEKIL
ncbi:MAG: hypothetical protein ACXABO_20280 [Promethearchaeota archaeon]|jgi:hypothetical protein